jgi:hypothetical protein
MASGDIGHALLSEMLEKAGDKTALNMYQVPTTRNRSSDMFHAEYLRFSTDSVLVRFKQEALLSFSTVTLGETRAGRLMVNQADQNLPVVRSFAASLEVSLRQDHPFLTIKERIRRCFNESGRLMHRDGVQLLDALRDMSRLRQQAFDLKSDDEKKPIREDNERAAELELQLDSKVRITTFMFCDYSCYTNTESRVYLEALIPVIFCGDFWARKRDAALAYLQGASMVRPGFNDILDKDDRNDIKHDVEILLCLSTSIICPEAGVSFMPTPPITDVQAPTTSQLKTDEPGSLSIRRKSSRFGLRSSKSS